MNKLPKWLLWSFVSCLFIAGINPGADAQVSRPIPVLQTNPDQRTTALGDVLSARQDKMSLFVSPLALIPGETSFGIDLSTNIYPKVEGTGGRTMQYNAVAGYKFLSRHAVSLSFRYQGAPEISYFDLNSPGSGNTKSVNPFDWSLDVAYGLQITRDFSMSISGNFVTSWIGEAGYTGGASIGAFYNHDFGYYGLLGVALKINDIGAPIYYSATSAYAMPASAQLSGEYGIRFSEKHGLDLLLGGRYFFLPSESQLLTIGGGVEYDYDDTAFVRLGGQFGTRRFSMITAGAGLKLYHRYALDLSYSHGLDPQIGIDIWSVGLSARF